MTATGYEEYEIGKAGRSRAGSVSPNAIYHFSAQVIGRKSGKSAVASAAYRAGEELIDERTGEVKDYTRKDRVDFSEISAPENAPSWVKDRSQLWNTVEAAEKRKDAQLCREINAALPTALTPTEQQTLVREYVHEQFVQKGMVVDWNIHDSTGKNPHVHMMLTMREIGPEGFGKKNRAWNDKALLKSQREEWAKSTNKHLERAGYDLKVDHRSLEAQGKDQIPQIHLGPKPHPERRERAEQIDRANHELKQLAKELKGIEARKEQVVKDYMKALPEREQKAVAESERVYKKLHTDRQDKREERKATPSKPQGEQKAPLEAPKVTKEAKGKGAPEKAAEAKQEAQKPQRSAKKQAEYDRYRRIGKQEWQESEREEWRKAERPKLRAKEISRMEDEHKQKSKHNKPIEEANAKAAKYERQGKQKSAEAQTEKQSMFSRMTGKPRRLESEAEKAKQLAKEEKKQAATLTEIRDKQAKDAVEAKIKTPEGKKALEATVNKELQKKEAAEEAKRGFAAERKRIKGKKQERAKAAKEVKKREQDKLKAMTPEERKAHFKEKRAKERQKKQSRGRGR